MYCFRNSKYIYKSFFKATILAPFFTWLLSSCAQFPESSAMSESSDKYNVDSMAKAWREQVRKNIPNPYEQYSIPSDNDNDYLLPKKPVAQRKPNKAYVAPPRDNEEDLGYGKFPRYNPDDDNLYLDPKNYPLYMDN